MYVLLLLLLLLLYVISTVHFVFLRVVITEAV
jgi:hypothetical protein